MDKSTAQRAFDRALAKVKQSWGPRRLKPVRQQPHENAYTYAARCCIDGDDYDCQEVVERIDFCGIPEGRSFTVVFVPHADAVCERWDFGSDQPFAREARAYACLLADAMQRTGDL